MQTKTSFLLTSILNVRIISVFENFNSCQFLGELINLIVSYAITRGASTHIQHWFHSFWSCNLEKYNLSVGPVAPVFMLVLVLTFWSYFQLWSLENARENVTH